MEFAEKGYRDWSWSKPKQCLTKRVEKMCGISEIRHFITVKSMGTN